MAMRVLKWIGITVLVAVLAIGAVLLAAPYSDGPVAMIPGGALQSGELITDPVGDWSFAHQVETIEMQLVADGDRSRTTWILVSGQLAYIPVTTGFPPGKSWHHLAAREGAALVRIAGKRYPVRLTRIEDSAAVAHLDTVNASKYPPAPGSDLGSWYFRLDWRGDEPPVSRESY
ncbi:MAG: hypothetical protein QF921_14740 [Pseudomonadales bacterium]|jgi:hypothetical protein|nr:hypothetical protein [Pseudomonadales bacterium]|tara:strand:+ start:2066 stop:2587 length:522 start_codon:yes stop_codon:yes gene_type:complete